MTVSSQTTLCPYLTTQKGTTACALCAANTTELEGTSVEVKGAPYRLDRVADNLLEVSRADLQKRTLLSFTKGLLA